MNEILKNLIWVIMIIVLTHTVFFIIYSFFACGDAFLALRNFYDITYGIRL